MLKKILASTVLILGSFLLASCTGDDASCSCDGETASVVINKFGRIQNEDSIKYIYGGSAGHAPSQGGNGQSGTPLMTYICNPDAIEDIPVNTQVKFSGKVKCTDQYKIYVEITSIQSL